MTSARFVFLILIFAIAKAAPAAECAHEIVFLAQIHEDHLSNNPDPEMGDWTAESQFLISRAILANPGIPVFSEAVYDIYDLESYSRTHANVADNIQVYRSLFPNGIPARFDEVSARQRRALRVGGANTLLLLGQLPALYPTALNRDREDRYFHIVKDWIGQNPGRDVLSDPEMYEIIVPRRERLALQEINAYFKYHPEKHYAFLVFGSSHNFARYPDLFNPRCIFTPTALQRFNLVWNRRWNPQRTTDAR